MADFKVEIEGAKELAQALRRYPLNSAKYLQAAGNEAGHEIIETQGLAQYPPATAANAPPVPYYIRGRGTEMAYGNLGNSERYGTQFTIKADGYATIIGNSASYAPFLTDANRQAAAMAKIGWRKMIDVANEKREQITAIYKGWVNKLLTAIGLR